MMVNITFRIWRRTSLMRNLFWYVLENVFKALSHGKFFDLMISPVIDLSIFNGDPEPGVPWSSAQTKGNWSKKHHRIRSGGYHPSWGLSWGAERRCWSRDDHIWGCPGIFTPIPSGKSWAIRTHHNKKDIWKRCSYQSNSRDDILSKIQERSYPSRWVWDRIHRDVRWCTPKKKTGNISDNLRNPLWSFFFQDFKPYGIVKKLTFNYGDLLG
jgi:hypothetical protein